MNDGPVALRKLVNARLRITQFFLHFRRDPLKNFLPIARLLLPKQPMVGYQGLSERSISQRQQAAKGRATQTGTPRAPARCATAESIVTTRSRFMITAAVSLKVSSRAFKSRMGVRPSQAAWPGFRIGIVWQGNPNQEEDRYRSVPLVQIAPLAEIPGVSLVSLQVGPGRKQLAEATFPVIDLGSRFAQDSLHDLAAVLPNLDLVITVCTSVAHLAGAMGLRSWVALKFVPFWVWQLDRPASPWYPTLRLFRQRKIGDWGEVFDRIAAEVALLVKQSKDKQIRNMANSRFTGLLTFRFEALL